MALCCSHSVSVSVFYFMNSHWTVLTELQVSYLADRVAVVG